MTQPTKKLLILLLFAFLAQEICCSSSQTLTNLPTAANGEVPIGQDEIGYYVMADLDYKPDLTPNSVKMLLSLSNFETALGPECLNFIPYDCTAHPNCKIGDYTTSAFYPLFMVKGLVSEADVILDYSSWVNKASLRLGGDCYDAPRYIDFSQRAGVIGLGTGYKADQSFIDSKVFSLDLKSGSGSSRLLFKYDKSLHTSEEPVTLPTDTNWCTFFNEGMVSLKFKGEKIDLPKGKIAFDLHSESISFPIAIFWTILDKLKDIGISCERQTYPSCQFSGSVNDLPMMYLNIGGKSILLPPALYAKEPTSVSNPKFHLIFRGLSEDQDGLDHASDNFRDAIILGAPFMRYYYPVFDLSEENNNKVYLYMKISNASRPSGFPTSFVIFTTVCILILVIGSYIICKRKPAQLKETPAEPPMMFLSNPNLALNPSLNTSSPIYKIVEEDYIPPPQTHVKTPAKTPTPSATPKNVLLSND